MGEDYYTHKQQSKAKSEGCTGKFLDFSNSSGTDIRPLFKKPVMAIDEVFLRVQFI